MKTVWGLGRDRVKVPATIVFNISIPYIPAPGIPYDWSSVTFYFNTSNINHLASGTQSLTNMSKMGNPPTPQLLMF